MADEHREVRVAYQLSEAVLAAACQPGDTSPDQVASLMAHFQRLFTAKTSLRWDYLMDEDFKLALNEDPRPSYANGLLLSHLLRLADWCSAPPPSPPVSCGRSRPLLVSFSSLSSSLMSLAVGPMG